MYPSLLYQVSCYEQNFLHIAGKRQLLNLTVDCEHGIEISFSSN